MKLVDGWYVFPNLKSNRVLDMQIARKKSPLLTNFKSFYSQDAFGTRDVMQLYTTHWRCDRDETPKHTNHQNIQQGVSWRCPQPTASSLSQSRGLLNLVTTSGIYSTFFQPSSHDDCDCGLMRFQYLNTVLVWPLLDNCAPLIGPPTTAWGSVYT